jgi:hypothetical protein
VSASKRRILILALLLGGLAAAADATWAYFIGAADLLITIRTGNWETAPGCTHTPGFWKNHPEAWPVEEITIGGVTLPTAEGIAILQTSPRGDATYVLAHRLIAAKLNIANGADPSAVADTIEAADQWLVEHPLGSDPRGTDRAQGTGYAETLTDYNEGALGPGQCEEEASRGGATTTASPTTTSTATSTETPTPTPTATMTATHESILEATPTPAGSETSAPTETAAATATEPPSPTPEP